ncbi:MAG: TetR/AcrR family transcriptional regulator [Pseudomonadota bacterium]
MTSEQPAKPNPRGRPALSEAEMAATRLAITQCAQRLFEEEGYHAVSMRRLAKEVGCTVMTLYRYFDRKIDILRALWGNVFGILFDKLDQIAAMTDDPVERLNAISLGYLQYWLDNRETYFLVFMSSDVTQSDVSIFVDDEAVVPRFALFQIVLIEALGTDAQKVDATLKAQLLLCSLNGIAHNLITISAYSWADPKALAESAVSGALAVSSV